jgi:hypothetical protein
MTEGERSIWEALVPAVIHPTKVAALEAMEWIEQPLCANDIAEIIGDEKTTRELVTYHLTKLECAGVIEFDHHRKVRGTFERYFVIA